MVKLQKQTDKERWFKVLGSNDQYLVAMRKAKMSLYDVKKRSDEHMICSMSNDKNCPKKMKVENSDAVGEKYIKDDDGNSTYSDDGTNTANKH